jgi:tetratricopeptide (TPR) repeat protein
MVFRFPAFCTLAFLLATSSMAASDETALSSASKQSVSEDGVALNARWDLGYFLFQNQDYAGAVIEFEKLRALMPKDATLLALIGSCYSMSGKWSEGEKALLQAWSQNHDDADLNGLLGQFYLSAHQPIRGAFYLEQALRVSPELEDLRARLVDAYVEAGQFEKSRSHLELLLVERGGQFGDPELDNTYARCLIHANRYKEAVKYAQGAHQADAANPRFARTLGLSLLGINHYSEAARLLAASRPWIEGNDEVYLQWGEALFQDRKWEEAEAAWLDGSRKFPASYALSSRLLEYYLALGRPDKAARLLDFAAGHNPGHPGNLLLDARMGRTLGRYSSALMALDRLKRRSCGSLAQEALWEEAQLDFEMGRFAACGKTLDRLLGTGARQAEAHLLKAKLALKSSDLAAAQAQVLLAREANPYNVKVYAMARVAFGSAEYKEKLDGLLRDAESLLAGSDSYAFSALRSADR